MDISVIPNVLGNSTNIKNALSQPWLITISNILVALGTIVLAYYTYKLAHSNDLTIKNSQNQFEELKKQYSISNLREKAISINPIISIFKNKIDELLNYLNKDEFIKYENGTNPVLKILPNSFTDIVKSYNKFSNVFRIVNNEIFLVYITDEHFRKYMGNAINFLNIYYKNAHELEKLVKTAFDSKPPESFIEYLKGYNLHDFYSSRAKEFLSVVYVIAVTGSRMAYTSGHGDITQFIENRYDDFHDVIITDTESQHIYYEIQTRLNNIRDSLTSAYSEIQMLDKIWQNEFII